MPWINIPLNGPIFQNADEAATHGGGVALENAFINDAGGHTRFPGLKSYKTLSAGRVYLSHWRGDLIAVTGNGQVYRIGKDGTSTNVTGVSVSGGQRVVFARTEDEIVMAAGGPIVRLAGPTTEILSSGAPDSTHVVFIGGYLIAIEPGSGRFYHSGVGDYNNWDPLDVFSAEGKADNLTAAIVTPYNELLLAGQNSIEQFELSSGGTPAFFRRWVAADGLIAPYTLTATKEGTWGVTPDNEFARYGGQVVEPVSDEVQMKLDEITNWTDSWAEQIIIAGQKFILLQAPNAENVYGLDGITLLYDYRKNRWSNLYGWDDPTDTPSRWYGWSYQRLWSRHFVGGEGNIYELDTATYNQLGDLQRVLFRTGHYGGSGNSLRLDDVRLRLKRGIPVSGVAGQVSFRVNRNNRGFSDWIRKGLGATGDRSMVFRLGPLGIADTWQFEYQITDAVPVEMAKIEANMVQL